MSIRVKYPTDAMRAEGPRPSVRRLGAMAVVRPGDEAPGLDRCRPRATAVVHTPLVAAEQDRVA